MKVTDEWICKRLGICKELLKKQSNYDVLHRPEILKSTNAAWQTVGMFQTDNLQQTGIMYGAFGDLLEKQKAYKANKKLCYRTKPQRCKEKNWVRQFVQEFILRMDCSSYSIREMRC